MSEAECEFQGPEFLFQQGPTLYADVGFDPGYRPGSTHRPNLQNNNIPALVDTGAFASCVDSKIAQVLNLPQIDHTVRVSGARGSHEHNMHLGQIYIPALDFTLWGRLIAVDQLAGVQPHGVLLGRDFLQRFRMEYEGRTGRVFITDGPI